MQALPEDGEYWFQRGTLLLRDGQLALAASDYQQVRDYPQLQADITRLSQQLQLEKRTSELRILRSSFPQALP